MSAWFQPLGWITAAATLGMIAACGESAPPGAAIEVEDAWVRTSGSGANSAAYMIVRNEGTSSERLSGARAGFARMTELHRTTIDDSGLARMGRVEGLDLPPGLSVSLEPGGYHIMLMEVESLAEGDTVALTLLLESSESVRVLAEVRSF